MLSALSCETSFSGLLHTKLFLLSDFVSNNYTNASTTSVDLIISFILFNVGLRLNSRASGGGKGDGGYEKWMCVRP